VKIRGHWVRQKGRLLDFRENLVDGRLKGEWGGREEREQNIRAKGVPLSRSQLLESRGRSVSPDRGKMQEPWREPKFGPTWVGSANSPGRLRRMWGQKNKFKRESWTFRGKGGVRMGRRGGQKRSGRLLKRLRQGGWEDCHWAQRKSCPGPEGVRKNISSKGIPEKGSMMPACASTKLGKKGWGKPRGREGRGRSTGVTCTHNKARTWRG